MNNISKYDILLLFACFLWGFAPTFGSIALLSIPPLYYSSFRFFIGCIILALFSWKRFKNLNINIILSSLVIAVFLISGFVLETIALKYILPIKVGMLISFDTIFIPIFGFVILKENFKVNYFFSIIFAFIGMLLINYKGGNLSFEIGDLLAFITAILYSIQVIVISKFVKNNDILLITVFELFFASIIALILGLCFESFPINIGKDSLIAVILAGVICSSIPYYIQSFVQSKIPTIRAGIIYSSTTIFYIVISKVILGNNLTNLGYIGACFIIFAVFNSNFDIFRFINMRIAKDMNQ